MIRGQRTRTRTRIRIRLPKKSRVESLSLASIPTWMARTHRGSGSGGLPYLLCGPECLGGFDLGVKLLRLEDLLVRHHDLLAAVNADLDLDCVLRAGLVVKVELLLEPDIGCHMLFKQLH